MKHATVQSVCECQARLYAELNSDRLVERGWAADRRRGRTEDAPAHTIGAEKEYFQVAWACPFCIRNVLRSFDAAGLAYVEPMAKEAPAA